MSNQCSQCGSYAINHRHHGRDGSDPDLCDVCYWHTRHDQLQAELAALKSQKPVPEKYKMQPYQTVDKGSTNYKAGWNACINAMLSSATAQPQPAQDVAGLLEWAVDRWHVEVANRPLNNVHRRTLDDSWRQVIRKLGGDPGLLCGPAHDALAAHDKQSGE